MIKPTDGGADPNASQNFYFERKCVSNKSLILFSFPYSRRYINDKFLNFEIQAIKN